jgi:hypothetical protein
MKFGNITSVSTVSAINIFATDTLTQNLTVNNTIFAQTISASNYMGITPGIDITEVSMASGNWDSTYTTVNSNSATWGTSTGGGKSSFQKTLEGADWDNQLVCVGVLPDDSTLTTLKASTIGTLNPSLSFNLQRRVFGEYNLSGENIFVTDQYCTSAGLTNSTFNVSALSAYDGLFFQTLTGVETGNLTQFVIYLEYTKI